MTKIILSSVIANKPSNGGNAWVILSWVRGLKKLGFDVYFVEQLDRRSSLSADGSPAAFEQSVNLEYFSRVVEECGLKGKAALVFEEGERIYGMTGEELLDLCDGAALLVNITGHLHWPKLVRALRRKAYVDLDPGFTQFWHARGDSSARLEGHDFYFTVGENIGQPSCSIPTGGIRWRPVRQPVVLEDWPVCRAPEPFRFTTVASWRGAYGAIEYDGVTYGTKAHEWRKLSELPRLTGQAFEIALDIHPAEERDLEMLRLHGWQLADPRAVAAEPDAFRRYVQNSGAEFSVAQGVYVATRSGWFSDRTVRYLASGKPALVQETGFSRNYPAGEGLVAFRTRDEAQAGVSNILRDYENHAKRARQLAEEFFDSDRVLGRLIEEVGVAP